MSTNTPNPIDTITTKLITAQHEKSQNFALNLSHQLNEQKLNELQDRMADLGLKSDTSWKIDNIIQQIKQSATTSIQVNQPLPPIDEYLPLAKLRQHSIFDTQSFITYAQKYGHQKESLIVWADNTATLIINEQLERGQREQVELRFQLSDEYDAWNQLINQKVSHKQLIKTIQKYEYTLTSPGDLDSMRSIKFNARIDHESTITEEAKAFGILIKTSAGEEMKKLPKQFKIQLPILDQDAGEPNEVWATVQIRLLVELPDDPQGSLSFTLLCPKWQQLLDQRIKKEIKIIDTELKDFLVIHAEHKQTSQPIGRPTSKDRY